MKELITELRRLESQATPGPWEFETFDLTDSDAKLIQEVRNSLLRLLYELETALHQKRVYREEADIYYRQWLGDQHRLKQIESEFIEAKKSLAALYKFNQQLCKDTGISKNYPSADIARILLEKWDQ